MKDVKELVGVYGTLKQGKHNHFLMGKSKYLGNGFIEGIGVTDSDSFPYAYEVKGAKVRVEMYEVEKPIMSRLDTLEGHPIWYERKVFNVSGKDVWVYLNEKESGKHSILESGIW